MSHRASISPRKGAEIDHSHENRNNEPKAFVVTANALYLLMKLRMSQLATIDERSRRGDLAEFVCGEAAQARSTRHEVPEQTARSAA